MKPTNLSSLKKFALAGWLVGLAVISIFVFTVDNPNPAWGKLWQVKPLLITPLASASGAVFFYRVYNLKLEGFKKALAISAGLIGFLISLWLGIVLGLNGTLWN
jgi:hypothetical protein